MKNRYVVRVFVNEDGKYGNPVGVIFDEGCEIGEAERIKIAEESGFSEVVYIEDIRGLRVRIYNPQRAVVFAGHATIGVAWLLKNILDLEVERITIGENDFTISHERGMVWVAASTNLLPPWNFLELEGSRNVESFSNGQELYHTVVWSWEDKASSIIRARTFAPDWGIPEDEANGSGSMILSHKLNQKLKILHGRGSVISVELLNYKMVKAGGRCLDGGQWPV